MGIKEALTHKVGPLPVWAYGAIAAGGTFLLLSGGKGKSSAKKPGSGAAAGGADGTGGTNTYTGNSTTTETLSNDQTFGGGSLGFLGRPLGGLGNVFVHLHPHPEGGYFVGGRNYNSHAFKNHGFGQDGRHRGGNPAEDHRHGFSGGRDHHGPNEQGGRPRGFSQGHYTPGPGIGSRIARSFKPGNTGNRGTRYGTARDIPADARPSNR